MGNAYPTPGLHGEVLRRRHGPAGARSCSDTVGRHDTFALACTRKYYEDIGYFGHVNCTDNFNGQARRRTGSPQRKGWEALNFFYNTGFDANNVLLLDEPWSRPGDYVLLRALTDLVCASSACPDDIDPANGWELHRRPRPRLLPENRFSDGDRPPRHPGRRARADQGDGVPPADERADPQASSSTAATGCRTASTTRAPIAEYWACREQAVVMDLSPLRKWEVLGPDAEALMQARDHARRRAGSPSARSSTRRSATRPAA